MLRERLIGILSDVHGNHFALRRCIKDATRAAKRDGLPLEFWVLGDVTNGPCGVYECMEELNALGDRLTEILLGNHDRAQLLWWFQGGEGSPLPVTLENRDAVAREATMFVRDQNERDLLADDVHALESFREAAPDFWTRWVRSPGWTSCATLPGVYLAHGLILERDAQHYANVISSLLNEHAVDRLNLMTSLLMLQDGYRLHMVVIGHTHVADLWYCSAPGCWEHPEASFSEGDEIEWTVVDSDGLWVLDVGSVGLQRDWRPGTAVYGLLRVLDDRVSNFALRRVSFLLPEALRYYRRQGSPTSILRRLEEGY